MTLSAALLLWSSAHAAAPASGDLVFTELHPRASPSNCEWFEVANTAGETLELDGCYIGWQSDTSRMGELSGSLSAGFTADAPALIARNTDSCKDDDSAPIDCVAWAEPERLTCTAPVDLPVSGISVTDSATGTLCLACGDPASAALPCDAADAGITLLDSVSFNWNDDFDGACTVSSDEGRCSAQHDVDPAGADDNDDLDRWCITASPSGTDHYSYDGRVIVGSPGEGNECPVPPDPCGAGDLSITEVMSRPQSTTDSWLEVTASDSLSGVCSLEGCVVTDVGPETQRSALLGAGAVFSAGDIVVMAQGGGPFLDQGEQVPALDVGGLYIGNAGDVTTLSISCDGEVIDSVPVDEDFVDARCPAKGCSAQVRPGVSAIDPDDPDAAFCLAPISADTSFTSAKSTDDNTYTIRGTPGAPNTCIAYDWPAEGELVITEVLADGAGSVPDWLEVHNPTDRAVEMQWCELRQLDAADAAGAGDYEAQYRTFFADDTHRFSVEPGGYAVLSKGDCLDDDGEPVLGDTGLSTSDDVQTSCGDQAYLFGSLFLKSDVAQQLELVCEGVVVDTAAFSVGVTGSLEGHSLQLDPSDVGDASANDDLGAWCAAPFTGDTYESADGDVNYGTPGAPNQCVAQPELKGAGVGCLCSGAGGAGAGGVLALMAGLAGLVGRRRRD